MNDSAAIASSIVKIGWSGSTSIPMRFFASRIAARDVPAINTTGSPR
jgi:hypothetical protein